MFYQSNPSKDYTNLNARLAVVKQLTDKGGLENLIAAYVILKNVEEANKQEKAVRGWKGTVFGKLREYINNNPELEAFITKIKEDLGQFPTPKL